MGVVTCSATMVDPSGRRRSSSPPRGAPLTRAAASHGRPRSWAGVPSRSSPDPSQHARRGRVHERRPALAVHADDAVAGGGEDQLVSHGQAPQRGLRLQALGRPRGRHGQRRALAVGRLPEQQAHDGRQQEARRGRSSGASCSRRRRCPPPRRSACGPRRRPPRDRPPTRRRASRSRPRRRRSPAGALPAGGVAPSVRGERVGVERRRSRSRAARPAGRPRRAVGAPGA